MVCKRHTVTLRPEICVKMFIFKVDVQSDHLETKCSWVKVSQGKMSPWTFQMGLNVTVDEMWVDVTSRHRRNLLPRCQLWTLELLC
jgi:hypothetical protein